MIKQGRTILATDFQSLSLFRIFFAAYLLGDFYVHVPFFADLYGDDGILPLDVLAAEPLAGIAVISPILHALEKIGVQAIFPILYPAALVAFGCIGKYTQATEQLHQLSSQFRGRSQRLDYRSIFFPSEIQSHVVPSEKRRNVEVYPL